MRAPLGAAMPLDGAADDRVVPLEELRVGRRSKLLDKAGRAFDVREQEGDRARREWALTHGQSRIRRTRHGERRRPWLPPGMRALLVEPLRGVDVAGVRVELGTLFARGP